MRRSHSRRTWRLAMLLGLLLPLATPGQAEVRAREGAGKSDRELPGRWKAVASVVDGTALSAEEVAANPAIMEITADKVAIKVGERVFMEGPYRTDLAQVPRTLDLDYVAKGGRATKSVGIYEVKGDVLKFCFVPEGGNRPRSFESKAGSGATLNTYKRAR